MKFLFLGIYAIIMCVIAFIGFKKTKTLNDFFLGGRKTGAWFSAFAYGTTYFSAVIFVGYAGEFGWNIGISATAIGLGNAVIGSFLAWKVLGKKTNEMTRGMGATTMPEFFEKRYDSKGLKVFSALVIFIFLVPYCASVYQGISYLFEQVFGIPFLWCVLGMAALTAGYLILGGYFATTLTDFVQGIVMLVGVALMTFFILKSDSVGGIAGAIEKLSAIDPELAGIPSGNNLITLISIVMLTSLGSWALPQMVHKFYAIRDASAINRGAVISTLFALVIGGCAYFSGALGRLTLGNQLPIDPSTGVGSTSLVVPSMLTNVLPDALLGIIVLLMLSASMSTLAGLVMASSSSIAIDLVLGVYKPHTSQKKIMGLMRVLCLVFIALSIIIALTKVAAIVTLMSFSWGTIAGTFLGPFLWGLHDKKTNRIGAATGMAAGFLTNILAAVISGFTISAPLIGCISMIVSLITVPVVSRIFPQKTDPVAVAETESAE